MSLRKSLRMLAVGIAVAGCVFVIPSYFGTGDDACAGNPHQCPPTCAHTACVTTGCGDDGIVATEACTHAVLQGPHLIECSVGCRTLACQ